MAIWKDQNSSKTDAAVLPEPVVKKEKEKEPDYLAEVAPSPTSSSTSASAPKRTAPRELKESVIAADINITGKIDGAGHVRIAGRFEGDVHIQGDLTIESGAKLVGSVRANSVTIGGEVEGNIESAMSVELLSTGILNGDLKAGTLTVASGSRMRGRSEFGWGDEAPGKSTLTLGNRQAS